MFGRDFRPPIFHYDHWPTYSATVASNEYGPMMMVDVYADKLAEPSSPPQSSEITDKTRGIPSQADDSPVHIDDKGV